MIPLQDNENCYVCGSRNQAGLRIAFEVQEQERTITARFVPRPEHEGFRGIVHGGVLSAVLDEAMAKLAFSLGLAAVTAEMTVKLKKPASPGDRLLVSGRLTGESKKLITARATIERGDEVIAEASGKLLRIATPPQ